MNGKTIVKNVLHLFYSTAFSSILNLVSLILLAKNLDSENYGMFSIALAIAMVMGYFTDIGLSVTVLREGSKKEANLEEIISSYIKIRIALLFTIFLIGFTAIHLVYENQELIKIMYFLIIPMVLGLSLQSVGITYFQLIEKMQYLGIIRISSAIFLVITISVGTLFSVDSVIISFLYGFSYLLAGIVGLFLVNKHIKLSFKSPFQKSILYKLWIFLLSGLLMMLLPQVGPIVLENTLTLSQLGLFAIAFRISAALYQVPGVIAGAFYPALFRLYNSDKFNLHLTLNILQIKIMSLMGMSITFVLFFMSEEIILLLFGQTWIHAADALQIMSLLLVLQSINIALADGLTTQSKQNYRTLVQFCSVVSAIFLFSYLSNIYLVLGAAMACICIETIALIGFWISNPNRGAIAKKVLVPYLIIFGISLLGIDLLFKSKPVVAIILSLLILIIMVLLDKVLIRSILPYCSRSKIWRVISKGKGFDSGTM